MKLSGTQIEQIQQALLNAYDQASLVQMLRIALNKVLEQIAGGANLTDIVFNLIKWAEDEGCISELIVGSYNHKPGNDLIQTLLNQAEAWPLCQAAGLTRWQGRAYLFASRPQELAYLDKLLADYRIWAERYTPLAGIAEVQAATQGKPRLDLPMLFMPTGFEKLEEHGFAAQRRVERVAVDDLRSAVIRYRRLVLLGEPGSGKTTTLWRLLFDFAESAKRDPTAPLPILAPLGGYESAEPALTYVAGYAGKLGSHLPAYLHGKRVILLLDALNEMPQRDYTVRVGRIQSLLDDFAPASVVVTCRALDYVETLKLEKLEVKPLDIERQRAYLHRYLESSHGETLFWQLAGAERAELWSNWQTAGGSWDEFWKNEALPEKLQSQLHWSQRSLWERFRREPLPPLLLLGSNPFMLIMLAQVYAGEGKLPQNRARLFAAFVDTLLERERIRHPQQSWLGADRIAQALAALAYAMQQQGKQGTAVSRVWASEQLAAAGVSPTEVLYLAASATLLDGNGETVRFVHQLLQEYFAALAWQQKLTSGDTLQPYWQQGWLTPSGWEETTILLAGLLPDMTDFVEQLLSVHPELAARCVARSGGQPPPATTISRIQTHLAAITGDPAKPAVERIAAGNGLNHLGDVRAGTGIDHNGLPEIVWCNIPAGVFLMGSDKKQDRLAYDRESPHHPIQLSAYQISQFPISNAQYSTFVEDGGYTPRQRPCWTAAGWRWKEKEKIGSPERYAGDSDLLNHPVIGVSWYEAVAFCNWLSDKMGMLIRLPSEAEWEKAARGADGRIWPWGNEPPNEQLCNFNSVVRATTPVGIYPAGASPYDALDMAGNVFEWTSSLYKEYPYKAEDGREYLTADGRRTLRGGSWFDFEYYVRCAYRFVNYPDVRSNSVGFRVVSPGF